MTYGQRYRYICVWINQTYKFKLKKKILPTEKTLYNVIFWVKSGVKTWCTGSIQSSVLSSGLTLKCVLGTFQIWSYFIIPDNYLELYQPSMKHMPRNLPGSALCKEMNEWQQMNEINRGSCSPHRIWKTLWFPSIISPEELLLNSRQWDVYNLYDVVYNLYDVVELQIIPSRPMLGLWPQLNYCKGLPS